MCAYIVTSTRWEATPLKDLAIAIPPVFYTQQESSKHLLNVLKIIFYRGIFNFPLSPIHTHYGQFTFAYLQSSFQCNLSFPFVIRSHLIIYIGVLNMKKKVVNAVNDLISQKYLSAQRRINTELPYFPNLEDTSLHFNLFPDIGLYFMLPELCSQTQSQCCLVQ